MFLRPFLWPIADAARCGRPSGCRLSILSAAIFEPAAGPPRNRFKAKPGHESCAFAPGAGHMAEEAAKIKPGLPVAGTLAYQPARQKGHKDARFHLSRPGQPGG